MRNRSVERVIRKLGIKYGERLYYHADMGEHPGERVKVKARGSDPSKVTVVLPGGKSCEASVMASPIAAGTNFEVFVPRTDKLDDDKLDDDKPSDSERAGRKRPDQKSEGQKRTDRRRADISEEVIEWLKCNWLKYSGPRYLYRALCKAAEGKGWKLPKESWLYTQWHRQLDQAVVMRVPRQREYLTQFKPFLPRNFSEIAGVLMMSGEGRGPGVVVLLSKATLEQVWESGLEAVLRSRMGRPVSKPASRAQQPERAHQSESESDHE